MPHEAAETTAPSPLDLGAKEPMASLPRQMLYQRPTGLPLVLPVVEGKWLTYNKTLLPLLLPLE